MKSEWLREYLWVNGGWIGGGLGVDWGVNKCDASEFPRSSCMFCADPFVVCVILDIYSVCICLLSQVVSSE